MSDMNNFVGAYSRSLNSMSSTTIYVYRNLLNVFNINKRLISKKKYENDISWTCNWVLFYFILIMCLYSFFLNMMKDISSIISEVLPFFRCKYFHGILSRSLCISIMRICNTSCNLRFRFNTDFQKHGVKAHYLLPMKRITYFLNKCLSLGLTIHYHRWVITIVWEYFLKCNWKTDRQNGAKQMHFFSDVLCNEFQ